MRAHEIREMTDEALARQLQDSHRELLNLRFRLATKQLTNTSEITTVKRNTARLNTIIRERQREAR